MAHIHTEPSQHDLTASAWIIRLDGAEPRIMLHHHRKLNALMQFGGHVELDEHPWETVAREIREESGYDLDQLQVLRPQNIITSLGGGAVLLPQPLLVMDVTYGKGALDHFHDDIAWAFVTEQSPRHPLGEGESRDIILLDRSQVVTRKDELWDEVADIILFIFDTALPEWHAVSTAPLIRQ